MISNNSKIYGNQIPETENRNQTSYSSSGFLRRNVRNLHIETSYSNSSLSTGLAGRICGSFCFGPPIKNRWSGGVHSSFFQIQVISLDVELIFARFRIQRTTFMQAVDWTQIALIACTWSPKHWIQRCGFMIRRNSLRIVVVEKEARLHD